MKYRKKQIAAIYKPKVLIQLCRLLKWIYFHSREHLLINNAAHSGKLARTYQNDR